MSQHQPVAERGALSKEGAPAAISVRGLHKRYGSVLALDNVNVEIRRGELFSLLGPSGCGKTTLLRIIGGFEDLDGGQVILDGADCSRTPAYQRKTNMIFQTLALFPHMSIFENVAFGLRRKRVPSDQIKKRVQAALTLVRLEGYDKRLPDQLSGGQRQRVAMARAIVNDPSVLLLDEPLGALDLQLRLKMQEELRRLHRELGSTFVFVTHDQGEAMTMSDRIAVMSGGKIQQVGTPEEIYENPCNRFVASFIGHTNLLDGEIEDVRPGGVVVANCGGIRLVARGASVSKGQKATVTLRYEKVSVVRAPGAESRCSVPCRIVERTYMGSAIRFKARMTNSTEMIADVGEVESVRTIDVGDDVYLQIPDNAAVVVAN